jgi:HD-GYP domain-containing protein (c-di-GMP phosphodiesterase class II)
MQFVVSRHAREGMCVAEDICDSHGRVLIARGQRLGNHHLIRLRKFHIRAIFIDPARGETVVKATRSELRNQCQQTLSDACDQIRQKPAAGQAQLNTASIMAAADNLIAALKKGKKALVTLSDVGIDDDRLLQHSVSVAVLGVLIGINIRIPSEALRDLAAALLFHDIGMISLPDELLNSAQPPTSAQVSLISEHAQMGYEHLVRTGAFSEDICDLVRCHHERLDGSGYPQGLRAGKLSPLVQIMAVVETYVSLTSTRLGIPAVLPDEAISYLIRNAGTQFAPGVVAALCRRIALYPEGTAVQLNSGEYGVVAGLHPEQPHRPVVLVHLDNKGVSLKQPMIVDLTADPGRGILRSAPTLALLRQSKLPEHAPVPIDPILANLG